MSDYDANVRQCQAAIDALSNSVFGLSPANRLDIEASIYDSFELHGQAAERRDLAETIRQQAQHQANAHDGAANVQIATILTAIGDAFADAMRNVATHIGPGS